MSYFVYRKKGSPYWQIGIKYQDEFGKWKTTSRSSKETDEKKAKDKAPAIEEAFLKKQNKENLFNTIDSDIILRDYCNMFFRKCDGLSPSSIQQYSNLLNLHVLPLLGFKKVKKITSEDIENLIRKKKKESEERLLTREQKKRDAKSRDETFKIQTSERPFDGQIKKIYDIIRLILNQAKNEDHIITENPCSNVSKRLLKSLKKYKSGVKPYTMQEIKTLVEKVIESNSPLEPVIVLASALGGRRGEILALKYSDFDFENQTVSFRHSIIKIDKISTCCLKNSLKNDASEGVLPISTALITYLKNLKCRQDSLREILDESYDNHYIDFQTDEGLILKNNKHYKEDNLDFICRNEYGEVFKPNYVSQTFNNLLKKFGLRHTRFHDIRHTAGTIILEKYNDPKLAQKNLRHKHIETTMNIYANEVDQAYIGQGAEALSPIPKLANDLHKQRKDEGDSE